MAYIVQITAVSQFQLFATVIADIVTNFQNNFKEFLGSKLKIFHDEHELIKFHWISFGKILSCTEVYQIHFVSFSLNSFFFCNPKLSSSDSESVSSGKLVMLIQTPSSFEQTKLPERKPHGITTKYADGSNSFQELYKNLEIICIRSSSSSCRAASTDIPDPLSPLLLIVHRLWQVFRTTSRILT